MVLIHPFQCYYADPEKAHLIACTAYDEMTPQARALFAEANPQNYINAIRSADEFSDDENSKAHLHHNAAQLKSMLSDGSYQQNSRAGFYIYRMAIDGHAQTGLIAELDVQDYQSGVVKKHERTQQNKEDTLIEYRDIMRASATPISTVHQEIPELEALLEHLQQTTPPLIDFTDDANLRQTLWFVGDSEHITQLQALFDSLPSIYLTDGHHRAAACERWAAKNRESNPEHTGQEAYNFVLTALFPAKQSRILAFNRVIHNADEMEKTALLEKLGAQFDIQLIDKGSDPLPDRARTFCMYLSGDWYRVSVRQPDADQATALDVQLLQDDILCPIFGISDPRSDSRIEYVPGNITPQQLQARVCQENSVIFICHPVAIEQITAIADSGGVMPPKSTWFDPKIRSGLLVRLR